MKNHLFIIMAAACSSLAAATVDSVSFTQDWPWSTDIKITYELSGVTDPVDISVEAFDGETSLSIATPSALRGEVCGVAADGSHVIFLDPVKAFGRSRRAYSSFKVRVTASASPTNIDETLYKIFDLSNGSCTDVTRKDLLNGKWGDIETSYSRIDPNFTTDESDILIWTGVTNDIAYKTTHLVMRKIKASNKVWRAGDPDGTLNGNAPLQSLCYVKLDYDYYIGVFEMTEAQHARSKNAASANVSPVAKGAVALYDCYAHTSTDYQTYWGKVSPGERICFPTNSYLRDVGRLMPVSELWDRTQSAGHVYEFTIPTRAEWEYACRGGNETVLYSGEAQTLDNVNKLAWHTVNAGGVCQEVGLKAPNAFGLYDMLGNVIERVCSVGGYSAAGVTGAGTEQDPYLNPVCRRDTVGTSDPSVMGGGSFESDDGKWQDCRPEPAIAWVSYFNAQPRVGYRVVMPARADGQWANHPGQ